MKKIITTFAFITSLVLSQNSLAADIDRDYYIFSSLGIAKLEDNKEKYYRNYLTNSNTVDNELLFDNSVIFALALGTNIDNNQNIELEYSQSKNDVEYVLNLQTNQKTANTSSLTFTTKSLFINYYWNFSEISNIYPFVAFGIGNTNIKAKDNTQSFDSDNVFSYQIKLGGSYAINERTDLVVSFRHLQTRDYVVEDSTFTSTYEGLEQNSLEVGVQFAF